MCAGHGTFAVEESTVTDGRTTPTRQGHFQKWDVWRKHEAELVYVANSEPTIWVCGAGRAVVAERVPISVVAKCTEVGRETRMTAHESRFRGSVDEGTSKP